MALIEIRDGGGNLLAAADDLGGAIKQLVDLASRYSQIIRHHHTTLDDSARAIAEMEPDTSATAPEHIVGFEAGWRACRDRAKMMVPFRVGT